MKWLLLFVPLIAFGGGFYSDFYSGGYGGGGFTPSSEEASDPYGPELVTNGTFDENTTGWNNASRPNGTVSWSSGRGRSTASASGAYAISSNSAEGAITGLDTNATYLITGDLFIGTAGTVFIRFTRFLDQSVDPASDATLSADGSFSFTKTPSATTMYIGGITVGTGAGQYFEIDNVSIKEVL